MNKAILYSLFGLLVGCTTSENNLLGTYNGFFYMTEWELQLKKENSFTYYSVGHLGGDEEIIGEFEIKGDTLILLTENVEHSKFLIDGDSCLIDFETRFDFCKNWKNSSRKRNINYPQLSTGDTKIKEEVEWMIQLTLENKELLEYISDTVQNLIIQEYYEITKESELDLEWYGTPVVFLSEDEIRNLDPQEYLIIDEVIVGAKSAMIDLQIMPEFSVGILEFFYKENGKWVHHQIEDL
jgi:hypothetical protein